MIASNEYAHQQTSRFSLNHHSRLDPALKERLRVRAAQHSRSMKAEARVILQPRWRRRKLRLRATWPE